MFEATVSYNNIQFGFKVRPRCFLPMTNSDWTEPRSVLFSVLSITQNNSSAQIQHGCLCRQERSCRWELSLPQQDWRNGVGSSWLEERKKRETKQSVVVKLHSYRPEAALSFITHIHTHTYCSSVKWALCICLSLSSSCEDLHWWHLLRNPKFSPLLYTYTA